uniref:Chromatin assembly factor 1 subunit A n=1 Tax=Anolis carolinensis TaxID=28377 RepID=H9G514_ANOCA
MDLCHLLAAMECRDKSATPGRKLIQARLPFKRLNPVPKEKLDGNSGAKKARNSPNVLDQNTLCASLSSDNVENGGEAESEPQFVSKLVNGKGPLDVFVQKGPKNRASEPLLVIDLVGNSCHRLTGNTEHVASGHGAKEAPEKVGNQAGTPRPPCGATEDIQMETSPAPAEKDESKIGTHSAKQSKLSNIIFERKLPVVVLEDIMARSPRALPLERSLASETMESIPEEDTAGTSSSLSSLSLASSPESLSTRKDTHVSPLAASTPARKVGIRDHSKYYIYSKDREGLRKSLLNIKLGYDFTNSDQERAEKGRLKEEAKAAKERAREEARRKKEEEKELKEKERKEKKEKDEKEKAEKLRVKEEKRKEKQEALEAKLEEKRKKEEEKRLKEEEKRLKEEEKAGITRFFQKPKTQPVPKTLAGWCGKFAPFEIKENMVLAPLCRAAIDLDLLDHFDWLLQAQDAGTTFLEELKGREPCRSGPTLVADVIGSDVVVVVGSSQAGDVPDRKTFGRMKLLQFCENHRPAYWGTWNKKSRSIRPRNPWSKDEVSGPGDDDDEGGEEEDEDDGFFVPHGYLSEDEGVTEECDPENHKARQKLKAKEWDELLTKGKRFRVLQPVKVGCVWEGAKDGGEGTNPDARLLHQFAVAVLDSSLADEEQTERNNKKKTKNQQSKQPSQ